ncbi:MAG: indole-3-glycerol phosphate synthase TrpC [Lachnospiraceae bacterium]|nr:indole-3-glycerol phosphate synthase TrpC [Lachnospiraceae bacterium]
MILDEIAARTRERIQAEKQRIPAENVRRMAQEAAKAGDRAEFPFAKALRQPGLSFICEVKKASPSKGVIAHTFPYCQIAREYEEAGASAISVLTEPFYFQGSDRYLQEIAQQVQIPIIRKDFTIDPYMIDQAKVLGASAILLICAILEDGELEEYQAQANELGLSALVEAHDAREVERALRVGAQIIGVNNRDLKTFQVDVNNSIRLRGMVPPNIIFVSESGIKGPVDTRQLYENGTDAVLIGETLMRSSDKRGMLERLRGQV